MIGTIHWNYPSGSTFIMLDGGNSKCNYPVCRVRGCECRYALGLDPARYPVPALRQADYKWGATLLECVVFDYFE